MRISDWSSDVCSSDLFNMQLMDTSKQDAIRVALPELGYEVPVTIDGVVVVEVEPGPAAEDVSEPGDTVVAIACEPLDGIDDVTRIMDGRVACDRVVRSVEKIQEEGVRDAEEVLGAQPN